jgi:hypothetical protein
LRIFDRPHKIALPLAQKKTLAALPVYDVYFSLNILRFNFVKLVSEVGVHDLHDPNITYLHQIGQIDNFIYFFAYFTE